MQNEVTTKGCMMGSGEGYHKDATIEANGSGLNEGCQMAFLAQNLRVGGTVGVELREKDSWTMV